MNLHPLTVALLLLFVKLAAVPVVWVVAWRLFKDLAR